MKMIVTRPFLLAGERQELGTEVEIESRADAAMLQHEGKAAPVAPVETRGPMTTQTASGTVAGGEPKPKGKHKDAPAAP